VQREIEDIEAVIANAGESANLYGVSTGGALALEAAAAGIAIDKLAHALAYDAACLGDGQPPATRLAKITRPTLVATGVVRACLEPRARS
jgi:pimeloyl-ACP methyl ester carboxylesterase